MKLLFLLLISVTVIHGCLRVSSPKPPKCECPSLAIGKQQTSEIENHNFYPNISNQALEPPTIVLEDCSISIGCDPEYSLVIFDTDDAVMFGEYGVDGMCEPYTQTWMADDGGQLRTFNRLYGACVGYGQCLCYSATVNEETFDTILGNHPRKEYIIGNALKDPYMIVEDCSISFRCDDPYVLVVFSSQEVVGFLYYPADGYCDSTSQTWQVATRDGLLTPFDKIWGVCVDYGTRAATKPPTRPTTPTPCPCQFLLMDFSIADDTIGHYDFYLYNISRYALHRPSLLYPGDVVSGCPMSFRCASGQVPVLTTRERSYEVRVVEMFCTDQMWTLIDGSDVTQQAPYVFLTCVDFSTPSTKDLPPLETMCNCSHELMLMDPRPNVLFPEHNHWMQPTISNDRCVWEIRCGYPTQLLFRADGEVYSAEWSIGTCDKSTNKWDIQYQKTLDKKNYTLNAEPDYDLMCFLNQ